jgi:hypothetical protein
MVPIYYTERANNPPQLFYQWPAFHICTVNLSIFREPPVLHSDHHTNHIVNIQALDIRDAKVTRNTSVASQPSTCIRHISDSDSGHVGLGTRVIYHLLDFHTHIKDVVCMHSPLSMSLISLTRIVGMSLPHLLESRSRAAAPACGRGCVAERALACAFDRLVLQEHWLTESV